MAGQQTVGIGLRKVFPLKQDAGEAVPERFNEQIRKLVVLFAAHSVVAPTQIEGIRQQVFIVGAHVEDHRKRARWVEPAGDCVERQLSDWNTHPTGPEVAEAEDSLAVCDHNDVDLAIVDQVVEHLWDTVPVGPGHDEAVLAAIGV